MKAAVLDLGTNTFQLGLYLVEEGPHLIPIEKDEVFVKMTKESPGQLSPRASSRALQAIKRFVHQTDAYQPDLYLAAGTEGFRTLQGSDDLQTGIAEIWEHPVRILSGEEEALLTAKGASYACPAIDDFLLMDIGGGSTEWVIVQKGQPSTHFSLPIGAAVMAERFDTYDQMTEEKRAQAGAWLAQQLTPVIAQVKTAGITEWIGTSGSFETLPELLRPDVTFDDQCGDNHHVTLSADDITTTLAPLFGSSLRDRLDWPGLNPGRAEYFLMAALQIKQIMDALSFGQLHVSQYGLREGLLLEAIALENDRNQSTS